MMLAFRTALGGALWLGFICSLNGATNAPVKTPLAGDPGVRQILEQAKLRYKVVPETGDYQLVIQLKQGRSQSVVISSQTAKMGELEMRRIWSPAAVSRTPFSAEFANSLLRDNFLKKAGSWALIDSEKAHTLCFMANVDAKATREVLLTTVALVAGMADEKEKELAEKDAL